MADSTCSVLSRLAAACAALSVAAVASAQSGIIYVDDDAPPGGNGQSWNTAFRDLQDALAAASTGAATFVGQGTYRPDRGTGLRTSTFRLDAGPLGSGTVLWLQGGFAGRGAPKPDLWDPETFVTVLDGDLKGNDQPGFQNRQDNAYHVVTTEVSPGSPGVNLLGVTVRGGYGGSQGGGIFVTGPVDASEALRLSFSKVMDNDAATDGGGVAVLGGGIEIYESTFRGNRARTGDGGGIAQLSHWHSVQLSAVLVADNAAGGSGGGATFTGPAHIERSTIAGNRALGGVGGGIRASENLRLTSCRLTSNTASLAAGGLYYAGDEDAEILGCTVTNNAAPRAGGVHIAVGDGLFRNTILWGNQAAQNPQGAIDGGVTEVEFCDVQGGSGGLQGGQGMLVYRTSNIVVMPGFADPDGPDNNLATWEDNDERLALASPCIDRGSANPEGSLDLDGHTRSISSTGACTTRQDMGAYEFTTISVPVPIPVLYVNQAAAPGGDGRSWTTAYRTLQEALLTPGIREVWVASGTYAAGPAEDDRAAHEIGCTLTIYGGFNGTETSAGQRDPVANPTTLSGQGNQRVMDLYSADLTIDGFTIRDGFSPDGNGDGGALRASDSVLHATRCAWLNNRTGAGALHFGYPSGGAISAGGSVVDVTDCRFVGNKAGGEGGAIAAMSVEAAACEFTANAAQAGGAIYTDASGVLKVRDSRFTANTAKAGGGAVVLWTGTLDRCIFLQNRAGVAATGSGGAVWAGFDGIAITNSMFLGNSASGANSTSQETNGGAVVSQGSTTITGCFFSGNRAEASVAGVHGGAVALGRGGQVVNCTLVSNWVSGSGGGPATGGGIWLDDNASGTLAIANSLLWQNVSGEPQRERQQVSTTRPLSIDHSCVQGWSGLLGGTGNHGFNPKLTGPTGPDGQIGTSDDDPRLAAFSPCIDAGRNSALPSGFMTDVLGNPRFIEDPGMPNTGSGPGPIADMGAAEVQVGSCYADCNGDGFLNLADFGCFQTRFVLAAIEADCNHDLRLDLADFGCFQTRFAMGCP